MAKKHFINFLGGLQSAVSPFLVGSGSGEKGDLPVMDNVVTSHKLGAIQKRLGYSQVGDELEPGKSITGLFNYRPAGGTQKILATVNNAAGTNLTLKYNNAGTWTDISLSSAWDGYEDAEVNMENFIKYCFFVGYDDTDDVWLPVASLTGIAFSTSDNVTDMPQAKYIKRYRDRLYIANCYESATHQPYRVYFSSVPSGGSITWDTANNFIDVDYGESITGLGENWDRLIIFTEYSAYMYDQNTKKKKWDVGCSNHRTIKNLGNKMIWANNDGVWVSTGGFPQNIAGRVTDYIKAGTPTNFFAEVVDEEYHLYVGNVTVNGISYSNCTLIYDISTQSWRVAEYYDTPTIFARYNDSGDDRLYMGLSDGDVMNLSKYSDASPSYSDDGNPISALFQTKKLNLGDPSVVKNLNKITTYADRTQGLNLEALIINTNTRATNKIKKLGQLDRYINKFDKLGVKGNMIQIIGRENSSNPYFSFFGVTVDYNT